VDLTAVDRSVAFAAFKPLAAAVQTDSRQQQDEAPSPVIYVEPPRSAEGVIQPPRAPAINVEPPRAPDLSIEPPRPPAAPAAPHMTAATDKIITTDGREMRHHSVRIDDDDIDTDDRFADLPRVVSMRCGDGADRPMVIQDTQDGKRRITVCNDRINRATVRANAAAANGAAMQRAGYRSALASLRKARADLVANQGMPADARREALQSIDESTADLAADMAQAD
jgi:hypothetical protein